MKNNTKLKSALARTLKSLASPLTATLFGLIVGAVVIFACGYSPIEVYSEMLQKSFIQPYYLLSTLTRSTPVIICAMATAIAWRAGYINIGVEGQMVTGTFAATACALFVPGPSWFVFAVSWIAGMAAGAIYALIPAFLSLKYNVTMVITTLMMNYIASYITSYFVNYPLKDTAGDGMAIQTPQIDSGLWLTRFSKTSTFNAGFVIAIAVLLFMLFITKKTVFGYESKMGGFNPSFARYGGVKSAKVMIITMALSGAIASIAGCTEVFGIKYRYADSMLTSTNYAWTGLMAALIAGLDPVGMFIVSIFLSGLQIGGSAIQRSFGIPLEISTIIQCCITLFVSVKIGFNFIRRRRATAKADPKPEESEAKEGEKI